MRKSTIGRAASSMPALLLSVCFAAAFFGFGHRFAVGADESTAATPDAGAAAADVPGEQSENPFPNRDLAPALDGGVDWLNTSGPISLKDLRGKVVLLDFWTYCCINCIHVLPDLAYLEEKYANELVVIGVHSAKFDNEKDSAAIREAILRYEIRHPVVNDANMVIWRKFGVRAWPTFVLIDPDGNYCGYVSGEGNREVMDQAIQKVIDYHASKGTLDRTPVRFDLEHYAQASTPLRYPGKILADPRTKRLYISDSNHNRIVVTSLDGELIETIGSGRIGQTDGGYDVAEFDHQQGMALDGDTLYVADTQNHMIRKVDLTNRQVSTLAGTGKQAHFREAGGTLEAANLSSPWDVLVHDGVLYIAMAGPHQIWSHTLGSDRIASFAGSGREDITDGARGKAAFAQPSGLATDGKALYVCDSEGSAIRRVPFSPKVAISTIAGPSDLPGGRSLFTFGDVDAAGSKARLQHPLGIAFHNDVFYIADSYNHKIKTIRLDRNNVGIVKTWLGTGEAGEGLDPTQFSEPAGLTVADGHLFVADTNNHRILKIDLESQETSVLQIAGLTPPDNANGPSIAELAQEIDAPPIPAKPQTIRPGASVPVNITLDLPPGYKINPAFPIAAGITTEEGNQSVVAAGALEQRIKATGKDNSVEFTLPLTGNSGKAVFLIRLDYGYCRDGSGGLCKLGSVTWRLPLSVAADGAGSVNLSGATSQANAGR